MTDTAARLQELQETICLAQAEIEALQALLANPLQQAINAYRKPSRSLDSDEEIEAGLRAAWPHLKEAMEGDE